MSLLGYICQEVCYDLACWLVGWFVGRFVTLVLEKYKYGFMKFGRYVDIVNCREVKVAVEGQTVVLKSSNGKSSAVV